MRFRPDPPHVLGGEEDELPVPLLVSTLNHELHADLPVHEVLQRGEREGGRSRKRWCMEELTMKTSNSSRQRKGDSMASQSAMMKETVAKERSPPDRERVFLVTCAAPPTFTYSEEEEEEERD